MSLCYHDSRKTNERHHGRQRSSDLPQPPEPEHPEPALRHDVRCEKTFGKTLWQTFARKGIVQGAIGKSLILLAPVEITSAVSASRQVKIHLAPGEPR